MRLIIKQSEEWIKKFYQWYNANQKILFEAFIKYYGEDEEKDLIKEINDIQFIFLLSDVAYLNCQDISKDYLAKRLELYFKHNNLVLNTLARKGAGNNRILNEAIKLSMLAKYPRGSFEYYLHEEFIEEPTAGAIHFGSDGTNPVIILPIYFINDRIIFHEINHVLTTPKKEIVLFPNVEADELLNELIIQDVLKIFKKLGGRILPYELNLGNEYANNLFLMKEFYKKFKDLIKKCICRDNLKLMEETLGKENLNLYFALVKLLYHKKYITDTDLEKLNFLIHRMEKHLETRDLYYNRIRLRKIKS